MAINYSLGIKTSRPGKRGAARKVYATAQYNRIVKADEMAMKVAHHSMGADRGGVMAVLTSVVDILCEQLLEGNRVELGELGSFYCVINGTGVDNVDKFSAQECITGLSVNWLPGKRFRKLYEQATFTCVPRRAMQEAAIRRDDAELEAMLPQRAPKPAPAPQKSKPTPEEELEEAAVRKMEENLLRHSAEEAQQAEAAEKPEG